MVPIIWSLWYEQNISCTCFMKEAPLYGCGLVNYYESTLLTLSLTPTKKELKF